MQKSEMKIEQEPLVYNLRDYQLACTRVTLGWLKANPGKHGIIEMPTGSGKSLVIADIIRTILSKWPSTKILILSHVKEILEQNKEKLSSLLPDTNIQLYSASLSSKKIGQITVGSVQTVVNAVHKFEDVRIIIVDECHSIAHNDEGSYNKIFAAIPKARVLGYTATPFRYNGPLVSEDHIFDQIIYRVKVHTLIEKGYLSPIYSKATKNEIDTSKLKVIAGDYSKKSLSEEVDRFRITKAICDDMLKFKNKRKHWLIFCVSIEHAEHVASYLTTIGVETLALHSKLSKKERELVLKLYTEGKIQAVTNVGVLTTGFDFPGIDLISLMRPTKSHVLHRQITGRGMRIAPGKNDCLILDYAGNFKRLGPIDIEPEFTKKGSKGGGEAPTKICPECDEIVPLSVKKCPDCGYNFPQQEKIAANAVGGAVLSSQKKKKELAKYEVKGIFYNKYQKPGKPPTLKVTYKCTGLKRVSEWIGFESPIPFLRHNAIKWWKLRTSTPAPNTVKEALEQVYYLRVPIYIYVDENGKFDVIKRYEFKGE